MGVESYILNPKLNVELNKSKVEQVTQSLEVRSDKFLQIPVPHVSEGVFEQMISIKNDLDTWVWISLVMNTKAGGEESVAGYAFTDFKLPPGKQLTLIPETSGVTNPSNFQGFTIKSIVDLRMPYDSFRLSMRPRVSDTDSAAIAPTIGALKLEFVRRF